MVKKTIYFKSDGGELNNEVKKTEGYFERV